MMKHLLAIILLLATTPVLAQRWLGGDVSLFPSYRDAKTVYRDSTGRRIDLLDYAHRWGWNMVRVRLFVDPRNASAQAKGEGVCQDLPYVLNLCRMAKRHHLGIMLDLHYSDTWADPSHQTVPRRWQGLEVFALRDSVYSYTTHVLEAMKRNHVEPELIQVGNEITYGMMWPVGRVDPQKDDNWAVLASLLNAGSKACREQCPQAKVIIHTEHAQDWPLTRHFYDQLDRYKVDYDVIGLSYYPMWHGTIGYLGQVVDSLAARYHRQVMVVEAAAYYSHERDQWATSPDQYSEFYPISPEGQRQFAADLVDELNRHPSVSGLFWWFPEENESGGAVLSSWLNRGLFSNKTGQALPAWYELCKFRADFHPIAKIQKPRQKPVEREYSPSTLIIYYDASIGSKPLLKAAKKIGAEVIYQYTFIKGIAVRKPDNMTLDETKAYFERVKGTLSVQYDRIYHLD